MFDPTAFSIIAGAVTLLGGAIVSWIVSLRTSAAAQRSQAKKDDLDALSKKQTAADDAHESLRKNYEAEITRLNTAQEKRDTDLETRRQQVETLFDEISQTKLSQANVVSEFADHKLMCQQMKVDLLEQIDMLKGALKTTTAVATAAQAVAAQPAATPPAQAVAPQPDGGQVAAAQPAQAPVLVHVVNTKESPVPTESAPAPPDGEKPG